MLRPAARRAGRHSAPGTGQAESQPAAQARPTLSESSHRLGRLRSSRRRIRPRNSRHCADGGAVSSQDGVRIVTPFRETRTAARKVNRKSWRRGASSTAQAGGAAAEEAVRPTGACWREWTAVFCRWRDDGCRSLPLSSKRVAGEIRAAFSGARAPGRHFGDELLAVGADDVRAPEAPYVFRSRPELARRQPVLDRNPRCFGAMARN
jgi:hypothetical protein